MATIAIVILSPILGTLADYKGKKKKYFNFFLTIGLIFTLMLAFVPSKWWLALLIVFVITSIGYTGTNIFYDAFLVDVSEDKDMDRISSLGYALVISEARFRLLSVWRSLFWQRLRSFRFLWKMAYKISFVITVIWWGIFSIPIIRDVHQRYGIDPEPHYIRKSFARIGNTLKEVKQHKAISYSFWRISAILTVWIRSLKWQHLTAALSVLTVLCCWSFCL